MHTAIVAFGNFSWLPSKDQFGTAIVFKIIVISYIIKIISYERNQ